MNSDSELLEDARMDLLLPWDAGPNLDHFEYDDEEPDEYLFTEDDLIPSKLPPNSRLYTVIDVARIRDLLTSFADLVADPDDVEVHPFAAIPYRFVNAKLPTAMELAELSVFENEYANLGDTPFSHLLQHGHNLAGALSLIMGENTFSDFRDIPATDPGAVAFNETLIGIIHSTLLLASRQLGLAPHALATVLQWPVDTHETTHTTSPSAYAGQFAALAKHLADKQYDPLDNGDANDDDPTL